MKFQMVQDLFQQQTVFSKVEDPDREILSVKYLTEDVLRGFENEIYVISEKAFRKRKFYIDVPNLLIAGAGEEPAPAVGSSDLLVLEHLSTEDCVNKVSEMLEKDRPFSTAESFLRSVRQQSYANKYDFNEIIEIIYELLKNPFSIANVNGGIINYKNIYNVNEYLSGILKRGEEIGVSDTTREISRQVSQSPGPVMFETIMGEPLRHIINKIVFQGKVVAYLFVAQIQSPFSEKDYPLIEMICQWISDEFAKNKDLLDSRRYLADHLLTDLLENDYGTSQEVHSRIEILKFGQKPYHYIVAADLRFIRDKKLRIENLKEALKQILKSSRDITYKENLVYYLNSDQNHYFDSEKMAALIDFCRQNNVKLGISYVYTDLLHTRIAWQMAREALALGRKLHEDKWVYPYQEYTLYHLTKQVEGENDIRRFCHPGLLALLDYDREHNTEHTYTLYMLLLSAGKKVLAADELHVHRSTLQYRLDKIEEISGGLDLYDTPTVTFLYLSFAILIERGVLDPAQYPRL